MADVPINKQPITVQTTVPVPVPVTVRNYPPPSFTVRNASPAPIEVMAATPAPVKVSVALTGPGPAGPPGPPGSPGPPGDLTSTQIIRGETPGGFIDGVNREYFSAFPYSPELIAVYLNGLRQRRNADYNETGDQSFNFLLAAPLPGDSLSIDYVRP